MKCNHTILFIMIGLLQISPSLAADISFMSFNLRYATPNDKENSWEKRKEDVANLVESYHPDFLGIQEGLQHQADYIQNNTSGYAYIGVGRDDGKTKGEYAALYYDTSKFDLIAYKNFWLSETPERASVGWDAAYPRTCTYGSFVHYSTRDTLHVFNTHFDNKGAEARLNSAKLILQKIKAYGLRDKHVVFMGDLNCQPDSEPIRLLKTELDGIFEPSDIVIKGPAGTFNGFDNNMTPWERIDYVFAKNCQIVHYTHIGDKRPNGLCVSDHLPVLAELSMKKPKKALRISKTRYANKLQGFWLGQCIANWTGLVTEMDKIGNIGEIKTGDFYTRDDWGKTDQPSIWGEGIPSDLSPTIDFVFKNPDEIWGADDDTDIEYMYQYLMYTQNTSILSPEQIRDGWLKHIKKEEENYLWVSNQRAFDLMQQGMLPPETSAPKNNEHYAMIDAQLTTEIFGLFAPARPDIALKLAYLPIRTSASNEAANIAEFYVFMHALASAVDTTISIENQLQWMAGEARKALKSNTYPALMYDYVCAKYKSGISWEQARDSVYYRYQAAQKDGYDITSQNLYCNGCFAAGINFAASIVSLFYGKGNLVETIKIGALCGWDSDNPTATWGGLLGFMMGKEGIEKAFGRKFSDQFNIHRTRQNFPNNGLDDFKSMAEKGIRIIDKVVAKEMPGSSNNDWWIIDYNKQIKYP